MTRRTRAPSEQLNDLKNNKTAENDARAIPIENYAISVESTPVREIINAVTELIAQKNDIFILFQPLAAIVR